MPGSTFNPSKVAPPPPEPKLPSTGTAVKPVEPVKQPKKPVESKSVVTMTPKLSIEKWEPDWSEVKQYVSHAGTL